MFTSKDTKRTVSYCSSRVKRYQSFNQHCNPYLDMAGLTTYEKINENIKFTEEETVELLKLSEKEILVLILSELKKITENTGKK